MGSGVLPEPRNVVKISITPMKAASYCKLDKESLYCINCNHSLSPPQLYSLKVFPV